MTVARYIALSLISRYHCLDPTNRDISGLHCIKYQYTRKFLYQPRKWLFGQPARKLSVDPWITCSGDLCFSSIVYPLSVVWSVLSWTEALGSQYLSYPNFPTVCAVYRIVTPVWIHWCLWNNAQRCIEPRRGALLFFEVIHQISRSYGLKNQWFE